MSRQAKYWYGFGPFRLDPAEHLLLREGHAIPLPPKAFATLLMLVQQSGHVLGKEELIRAIWPETFVEENNLTQCVSTLRKALGEGRNEQQYIETVPRLGYRFVAEVRVAEGEDPGLVLAKRTRAHIVIREEKEEQEISAPDQAGAAPSFEARENLASQSLRAGAAELGMPPAWPARGASATPVAAPVPSAKATRAKRWKWLVPAVAVALLLVAATLLYFRRAQPLTERDSILLADLVNTTGEPVFDGTLKQALAVKLEESPFLNVVPEQRVRETLRFMGRSPDERLTAPVAQEICERRGIKAMLTGSIAALGSHYVIALEVVNCPTGDSLGREQVEAESREQVLRAVGKATSKLRRKLGESLSSIKKFDAPIEEATTSSLEALKAYSVGEALRAKGVLLDAIPFFERAIELDPNFALAYGRLGSLYVNIGEAGRAAEYKKKAFELRERVSEREKLYITAMYYHTVSGEIGKTVAAYEVWKRTYARDWEPYNDLGAQYNSAGQFDRALEEGREAMRLNSNTVFPYSTSGWASLGLNRYEEAKGIFEQALAHKLDSPNIHRGLYAIAFVQGDAAAMQRQAEWARGKPDEYRMLNFQAQSEAFFGKLQRARETYRRSVALAQRGNFKDNAATIAAGAALMEANFGNPRRAREKALAALAIARGSDALGIAAAALALSGDARQAQALSEALAERYPTDTLVNAVAVSSARAAIGLHNGDPAKALELLQSAVPYEFGPFVFGQGYLPIYIRGQACLRVGKGTEAAAEFQKILDHRGAAPFSPLYALAHLGLARAYVLSGDLPKGRRAYDDFLALWKDADPDIPILQEAKAQYARLK